MDILGWLIGGVLIAIPFFRIFTRAGLSPWWSLLVFLPLLGLFICWLILAIAQWKSERAI